MTLEQFLQAVQPGLTLYGVLLTFALISFAVGRFFWNHERELVTENIDRLRGLMAGFRRRYIEPILKDQLGGAIRGAYEVAINSLLSDLYPKTVGASGDVDRQLVGDEVVKELVSQTSLRQRLDHLRSTDRSLDDFLTSASGDTLFDQLDHAYERMSTFSRAYHNARRSCQRVSYSFLILALLFLAGMPRILLKWPDVLILLWLFIAGQALLYGVYYFVKFEFYRRGILRMWEEMELYGKI